MKERGVSQAQVLAVLRQPEQKNLPCDPGHRRWRKKHYNGNCDVVFTTAGRPAVITVMILKG